MVVVLDNDDVFHTKHDLQTMITYNMNTNANFKNGFNILNKNPGMLRYQRVDGRDQVVIRSTVGKIFQGSNKPQICQETIEVEKLLTEFYSTENPNVQIIRSDNVTNMNCPPASGGSKSRRRKPHNKRAYRSKSKTQRRRRARMSRK